MSRKDILKRRKDIEEWISQKRPKAFICRELNCRPSTLNSYLKRLGISYNGNKGEKGFKRSPHRKSASEYLHKGSTINSHKLKLKIIEDNIKEQKCEACNRIKWQNDSIPLQLHHINGDRFDNRLSNLQILCPNCHALTDNFSGRKAKGN